MNKVRFVAALAALGMMAGAAQAASVSSNFTVQITIINECKITTAPGTIDFGSQGLLDTTLTASTTFGVTCTNGWGYTMALNTGANDNGSGPRMVNGTEDVAYSAALSTSSDTGTGSEQTHTITATVAPQSTPTAGTYTDTMTVTVTY